MEGSKWKVWKVQTKNGKFGKNACKTKVITLIKIKGRSTTITSDLLYQSLVLPGIAKKFKDPKSKVNAANSPPRLEKCPKVTTCNGP